MYEFEKENIAQFRATGAFVEPSLQHWINKYSYLLSYELHV